MDLAILQNAISSFKQSNPRAPRELSELVPAYLSQVPKDPNTGQDYAYSNKKGDLTFYLQMVLETDTSLGQAGTYCLTSEGVKRLDKGTCKEE